MYVYIYIYIYIRMRVSSCLQLFHAYIYICIYNYIHVRTRAYPIRTAGNVRNLAFDGCFWKDIATHPMRKYFRTISDRYVYMLVIFCMKSREGSKV